jgi:hypothetical protein
MLRSARTFGANMLKRFIVRTEKAEPSGIERLVA